MRPQQWREEEKLCKNGRRANSLSLDRSRPRRRGVLGAVSCSRDRRREQLGNSNSIPTPMQFRLQCNSDSNAIPTPMQFRLLGAVSCRRDRRREQRCNSNAIPTPIPTPMQFRLSRGNPTVFKRSKFLPKRYTNWRRQVVCPLEEDESLIPPAAVAQASTTQRLL
jgi:hypothetical protein